MYISNWRPKHTAQAWDHWNPIVVYKIYFIIVHVYWEKCQWCVPENRWRKKGTQLSKEQLSKNKFICIQLHIFINIILIQIYNYYYKNLSFGRRHQIGNKEYAGKRNLIFLIINILHFRWHFQRDLNFNRY